MQTAEEKRIIHNLAQKKYKLSKKGKKTQKKYYFSEAKKQSSLRYYYNNNQFKYKIHKKVAQAIKLGILIKEPCEICNKRNAFAHHDDYTKPLDIRWLCNYHHCEFHRKNKN